MDTCLPYRSAAAITPHDSNDQGLSGGCSGLYIGGAGALSVVMFNGATVTFANVAAGWLPLNVLRVKATGTAATGIVALFN
jgi:hypothetical protein